MENNKTNMYCGPNFRTDLACEEVTRVLDGQKQPSIEGVTCQDYICHGLKVNKTVLQHPHQWINKRKGTYYTIDLNGVDYHDTKTSRQIEIALNEVIRELIVEHKLGGARCLVVGLGNVNVTPDSLGPYVLDNIVVTRHLFKHSTVSKGYSEVCALTPGVMGNTGIETSDIIASIVKDIDIDFIIVIDALASAAVSRINRTIQVTDTGISPGSGVGNKRKEISFESLGKPVIAIGVPTVVDAITIVSDTFEYMLKHLHFESVDKIPNANLITLKKLGVDFDKLESPNTNTKKLYLGEIGLLDKDDLRDLLNDVLTNTGKNLMVTPKEVDADIEDLAKIIAAGIDYALHDSLKNLVYEE